MSKTIITVERVNEVKNHPNADRLDVIQVLGFKVVTGKGNFKVGDLAVYFPPDILLPPEQAEALSVTNYLKHAVFPGDTEKTQCRVGAARLRGVPSHGFCSPSTSSDSPVVAGTEIGTDVTSLYGAHKYEPPVRLGAGDAAPDLPAFHAYTSIENIQRYPDAFKESDKVVITEKLHGTNCRLGLVRDLDGEFSFCAGSHNVRRKMESGGLYWDFMAENVMNLLSELADAENDTVLFCEIFGPGVQDMDYGLSEKDIRVFDISVNGVYLNYQEMLGLCNGYNIKIVPQLYFGPFSTEIVEKLTYGKSTFTGIKSKFKDREGCVIRPWEETFSDILGGRLILKSVSADYRNRKGATDTGE